MEHLFSQNTSGGCFWKYLMNSLFIAFEKDECCHFVARIGSPALTSFYFVCFVSFYLFLFFFLWILLLFGFEVSLSIFKIKHWRCPLVPCVESGFKGWIFSVLVINVTGLVQFGKNLSYIFRPLVSQKSFQQGISVKLISQFLYLIYGCLCFRYLEKVFEEERNEDKRGNILGVTTTKLSSEAAVQKYSVKNFTKIPGKHLCESMSPATLKKRPWHRCFPLNFMKLLRTLFLIKLLWWLLVYRKKRTEN